MKETLDFVKKHYKILIVWSFLIFISSNLKLGFLIGSQNASLSLLVSTLPIIAYFFPWHLSVSVAGGAWILTHMTWPFPVTLGVPTFFATLSWNASKKKNRAMDFLLHVILPFACMTVFCLSPVGSKAWLYSIYWWIPIVLFFFPFGLVGRALKSTFLAHAIGSVIWMYISPMTHESWMLLIPIVAFERLLSASWSLIMIAILTYAEELHLSPKRFYFHQPIGSGKQ